MSTSSASASHAASSPGSSRLLLAAIVLCFVLSGFAALLYQTAWLRLFSIYFGTSEYAVATVLAAYMGGLALGAHVSGRFLSQIRRPVLVYGALEGLIAASALAVPLLLQGFGALYALVLGGQPAPPSAGGLGQPAFYLVASFLVLLLPTACMGATLPILMRHVIRSQREVGPRTGLLYCCNTLGAVAGTLVAGFLLLPALGLQKTVWVGVGANALVFLVALWVSRLGSEAEPDSGWLESPASASSQPRAGAAFFILPLMLLSGVVSFSYEVLWTRLLGYVLGGSVTAFSTMLAAFLGGIALGGGFGGAIASTRARALSAFVATQTLIGLTSAAVYAWIEVYTPGERSTLAHAALAIAVLLPSTVFIGATFPLAVRVLARDESNASGAAARIYAWNTSGAIVGSIAATFLIVPWLGFAGTARLAVTISLALAFAAALRLERARARRSTCVGLSALILLATLGWRPERPRLVTHNAFTTAQPTSHEEFYAVGRSAAVRVLSDLHQLKVFSNALPEAGIKRRGAQPSLQSQQWLGTGPPLFRPQAKSMLVVGLGGGVTVELIPASIERIDVIELEEEIVRANRHASPLREHDPLQDPRVRLVVNDARNALRLTDARYDLLVSQPSHPWTAGASHLFSREYIALAKDHLTERGVLLFWLDAHFLSEALLRDLIHTLQAEFEHVTLLQPSELALHFYASDAPCAEVDQALLDAQPALFQQTGIVSRLDVEAALALTPAACAALGARGRLITDDDNRMATQSRPFGDGMSAEEFDGLIAPHDPFVHGARPASSLSEAEQLYLLRALARRRLTLRYQRIAATLPGLGRFAAGPSSPAQQAAIARAAAAAPDSVALRYLALAPTLEEGALTPPSGEDALASLLRLNLAARERDWPTLLAQDARLAEVDLLAPYAPLALRLRAEARLNTAASTPDELQRALAWIELAFQLEPSPTKQLIRAGLATRAGDVPRIIDAAARLRLVLNSALAQRNKISPSARSRMVAIAKRAGGVLTQIRDPLEQRRRDFLLQDYARLLREFAR